LAAEYLFIGLSRYQKGLDGNIHIEVVLDKQKRNTPFKDNISGKDWIYGLLKGYRELSERRSQLLGKEQAIVTKQQIIDWFDGLRTYLSNNEETLDILDNPTRMYNVNESGCPLLTSGERVLAPRGASHVYQISSYNRGQITKLAFIGVAGDNLSPLMIFPGKRFHYDPLEGFLETCILVSKIMVRWALICCVCG
jgi:hypothetical protein